MALLSVLSASLGADVLLVKRAWCRHKFWPGLALAGALLVSACVSGPEFRTVDTDPGLTPRSPVTEFERQAGSKVVWGGVLVTSENLEQSTRLEILAYPLNVNQRPLLDHPALGRFLADAPGYLETIDYAAGREVTVSGVLRGVVEDKVGDSAYRYPRVDVVDSYLWPKASDSREPQIRFGVGISFGF